MKLKFNRKRFLLNYLLFISLYLVMFYFVDGELSQERIVSSLIVTAIFLLFFSFLSNPKRKKHETE